jgi:hypothetical protein
MKELAQIAKISNYYFTESNNQIACVVRLIDGQTLMYFGSTRSKAYERAKLFLN